MFFSLLTSHFSPFTRQPTTDNRQLTTGNQIRIKNNNPTYHLPLIHVYFHEFFTVANDLGPSVREAFINRPHLVDQAPGFVRMEVFTPRNNPDEFWLMTYWENEESFQEWYKGHQYHDSHAGIPKGVKLVPQSVWVKYFDQVQ